MNDLPCEIIIIIFKYINPISILKNCSFVSYHWNNLCNDNQLWSYFCYLQKKKIKYTNLPLTNSKKQLYKILMEKHSICIYKENVINSKKFWYELSLINGIDQKKIMELMNDQYKKILEKKEIKFYKYASSWSFYMYLNKKKLTQDADDYCYFQLYSFTHNFISKLINYSFFENDKFDLIFEFILPNKSILIKNNNEFLIFQPNWNLFLENYLLKILGINWKDNRKLMFPPLDISNLPFVISKLIDIQNKNEI